MVSRRIYSRSIYEIDGPLVRGVGKDHLRENQCKVSHYNHRITSLTLLPGLANANGVPARRYGTIHGTLKVEAYPRKLVWSSKIYMFGSAKVLAALSCGSRWD